MPPALSDYGSDDDLFPLVLDTVEPPVQQVKKPTASPSASPEQQPDSSSTVRGEKSSCTVRAVPKSSGTVRVEVRVNRNSSFKLRGKPKSKSPVPGSSYRSPTGSVAPRSGSRKRSALLAGLNQDNIIPSVEEDIPTVPSSAVPTSSAYKTRAKSQKTHRSELCYDQKYHPMDDFIRPKNAAKMKSKYGEELGGLPSSAADTSYSAVNGSDTEVDTEIDEAPKRKAKGRTSLSGYQASEVRRTSRRVNRDVQYNMNVHPQDDDIEEIERMDQQGDERKKRVKVVLEPNSDEASDRNEASDSDEEMPEYDEAAANAFEIYNDSGNNHIDVYYNDTNDADNANDDNVHENVNEDDADDEGNDTDQENDASLAHSLGLDAVRAEVSTSSRIPLSVVHEERSPFSSSHYEEFEDYASDEYGNGGGYTGETPYMEDSDTEGGNTGEGRATAGSRSTKKGKVNPRVRKHKKLPILPFVIYEEPLHVQLAREAAWPAPLDFEHDDKENIMPREESPEPLDEFDAHPVRASTYRGPRGNFQDYADRYFFEWTQVITDSSSDQELDMNSEASIYGSDTDPFDLDRMTTF